MAEVSSAKRDQNHEFIKLQSALKTLFLSLFLPEPLVEKNKQKKCPPLAERGGYHFLSYLTCHLRQSALAVTSSMHLFKPSVFEGH